MCGIADVGREEFEEAHAGTLAGGHCEESRSVHLLIGEERGRSPQLTPEGSVKFEFLSLMFEVVRQVNAFVAHLVDEEVGERPHERVDAIRRKPCAGPVEVRVMTSGHTGRNVWRAKPSASATKLSPPSTT